MKMRNRTVKRLRQIAAVSACTAMICTAFAAGFTVNAEEKAASSINVYMTVSDKGEIAKAKDGTAMAAKKVTVTDRDSDGEFSFDEALIAAHKACYSTGINGYATTGTAVTKLWGVEDSKNYLFFINSVGIPNGVKEDHVKAGDYLTASHISDTIYNSDLIASFDQYHCDAAVGGSVSLNLKGHIGKPGEDETDQPVSEALVIDTDGNEYGKTDDEGNVTLSFDQPGTYYVTAKKSFEETADIYYESIGDGYWFMDSECEDPEGNIIYGKIGSKLDFWYGYTLEDYGEGPYPWDEVKWMSEEDFEDGEYETEPFEDGHFLIDSEVIIKHELIAPVCVITVKAKEESRPVYRLYNQNTKEHLYTSSKNEYNVLGGKGWKQEGTGWYAPKSGKAVYRLYNPKSGDHHYTADAHEAKTLSTKYGWKYDNNGKALFYSGGDVPVYRVYNKTLKRGAHHFTKSLNEYNTLPEYGWTKEGIAFYAVK